MRSFSTTVLGSLVTLSLIAGCGDDGGSSSDDTASESTAGPTTDPTTDPTTTDPTTTTSADTGTTGGVDEGTYAALIRGPLFTDEPREAREFHDPLAMGGEDAAMMLGDFGHDVLLGTTILGTTENEFLGIDQWDNLAGANTFYGDPAFAEQFGMLFSAPPSLELFELKEDWHTWGSLTAGDSADPYFFIVVRGTLVDADLGDAQAAHDAVASAGEAMAMAAGDVAHVVWLGVEDDHEFFAIDIWTDSTNIEAFYTDPTFVQAFGALFTAPPTLGVYQSTEWYQW